MGSALRLPLDHSRFPIEPADQRIQDHPGLCRTNAMRQSEHEAVCIQQLPYHTTHGFRPSDGRSARRSSTGPRDNLPDPSMSLDPPRTWHFLDECYLWMVATPPQKVGSTYRLAQPALHRVVSHPRRRASICEVQRNSSSLRPNADAVRRATRSTTIRRGRPTQAELTGYVDGAFPVLRLPTPSSGPITGASQA
jgi:hypothetical protein